MATAVNAGARLDRLPISSFHYRIFWLVGAGMFFDGYDLYVAAGVLASTIQTKFSTLPQNLQFISWTFIGMTLGSLITGFVGDKMGRRFTYQINLLIFGLASIAAAFAENMTQLIFCRFVQGLGLGAEIVVGYSTLTEFVPPKTRGRWLSMMAFLVVAGFPATALLGYLIIPTWGWRPMFVIAGVGSLIVWYLRKNLPESPRWLEAQGRTDARAYLASRPVEVELRAIQQALDFAGETRCALHIVHVSSPEGLALIAAARQRGVDVTAETCPHYLLLNESDVIHRGAPAKCAPPLRDEPRRLALWEALRRGAIETVGSDHSPAPAEMKTSKNFFAIWGGIGGVQHGFELLLSESSATGQLPADLPVLAAVLARNVARRFRLGAHKGVLAEGADADFSLVEFGPERVIGPQELLTRHPITAYEGRRSRARITHTFVRGEAVWAEGRLTGRPPGGRFLRPETKSA